MRCRGAAACCWRTWTSSSTRRGCGSTRARCGGSARGCHGPARGRKGGSPRAIVAPEVALRADSGAVVRMARRGEVLPLAQVEGMRFTPASPRGHGLSSRRASASPRMCARSSAAVESGSRSRARPPSSSSARSSSAGATRARRSPRATTRGTAMAPRRRRSGRRCSSPTVPPAATTTIGDATGRTRARGTARRAARPTGPPLAASCAPGGPISTTCRARCSPISPSSWACTCGTRVPRGGGADDTQHPVERQRQRSSRSRVRAPGRWGC